MRKLRTETYTIDLTVAMAAATIIDTFKVLHGDIMAEAITMRARSGATISGGSVVALSFSPAAEPDASDITAATDPKLDIIEPDGTHASNETITATAFDLKRWVGQVDLPGGTPPCPADYLALTCIHDRTAGTVIVDVALWG